MKRALLVSLGLVALVGAGCGGPGNDRQSADAPTEGDAAPSFRLPSGQGAHVSLADYRGKQPVLLYFSMGPG